MPIGKVDKLNQWLWLVPLLQSQLLSIASSTITSEIPVLERDVEVRRSRQERMLSQRLARLVAVD